MRKPKEVKYRIEGRRDSDDGKYIFKIRYRENGERMWQISDSPVYSLDECFERINYYKSKGKIEILIQ